MMSVCQIKDSFGLVGKSCLAESFSNEHPECAFRGMNRDDLPSYDHSAILAPVHENPSNSGVGAAEIPHWSGADLLGLRQCLHNAITHFRGAEVLSATADVPSSTAGRKHSVHCSFNGLSLLLKLQ